MLLDIVSIAMLVSSVMFIMHFLLKLKHALNGPVDFKGNNDKELYREARQRLNSLLIKNSPFLLIGLGFLLISYFLTT